MDDNKKNLIIIRKIKKSSHATHHGGSWKIAYADFVTAMMAFFLLMWLINVTSEEQRRGLANFFDPISSGSNIGGNQGVMGGTSIQETAGNQSTSTSRISIKPAPPTEKGQGGQVAGDAKSQEDNATQFAGMTEEEKQKTIAQQDIESKLIATQTFKNKAEEEHAFENISNQVKQAMESIPELKELKNNINIEETKEGLRINIIDQNNRSMFPSGSSRMYKQMQQILIQIAKAIKDIPNKIDISGHTDAVPYTNNSLFSNWELSAERANASRRVLAESGIMDNRFDSVVGRANRDPFDLQNPKSPSNRRISIMLLREIKV